MLGWGPLLGSALFLAENVAVDGRGTRAIADIGAAFVGRASWERPFMNLERAYREFRGEPLDAPWDTAAAIDAIYQVAKARGIEVEF